MSLLVVQRRRKDFVVTLNNALSHSSAIHSQFSAARLLNNWWREKDIPAAIPAKIDSLAPRFRTGPEKC